jgi:hypothetical protein
LVAEPLAAFKAQILAGESFFYLTPAKVLTIDRVSAFLVDLHWE